MIATADYAVGVDDTVAEGAETITVAGTVAPAARVAVYPATLTITDAAAALSLRRRRSPRTPRRCW